MDVKKALTLWFEEDPSRTLEDLRLVFIKVFGTDTEFKEIFEPHPPSNVNLPSYESLFNTVSN